MLRTTLDNSPYTEMLCPSSLKNLKKPKQLVADTTASPLILVNNWGFQVFTKELSKLD